VGAKRTMGAEMKGTTAAKQQAATLGEWSSPRRVGTLVNQAQVRARRRAISRATARANIRFQATACAAALGNGKTFGAGALRA